MKMNTITITHDKGTGRWTASIAAGEAVVSHADDRPIAALCGLLTLLDHAGYPFAAE